MQTRDLARETREGHSLWPGIMGPFDFESQPHFLKDTANTDVIHHNGSLLALWYMCGEPYRLDPATLDTTGIDDFGGQRATPISAHPKVDPRTGELVWFTLSDEDDGYCVTIVTSCDSLNSECWVFSARDIEKGPIAKVSLPTRVPTGFHAKRLIPSEVWGEAAGAG